MHVKSANCFSNRYLQYNLWILFGFVGTSETKARINQLVDGQWLPKFIELKFLYDGKWRILIFDNDTPSLNRTLDDIILQPETILSIDESFPEHPFVVVIQLVDKLWWLAFECDKSRDFWHETMNQCIHDENMFCSFS